MCVCIRWTTITGSWQASRWEPPQWRAPNPNFTHKHPDLPDIQYYNRPAML
jgi:hypothetical protein